jgi:hypothetical protein
MGKPKRKRSLETSRRGWKNNYKMDLKKIELQVMD